jgi:hypothetical protein
MNETSIVIDKTIRIIIDDVKKSVIHDITNLLADASINIEQIDAEAIDDKGIIHIAVEQQKYDIALNLLKQSSYYVIAENSRVFQINDKPGALAKLTEQFKNDGLSIKSIRFINRNGNSAMISVVFDNL